ncbi:MAG TPA: hypothetical protein VN688_11050 [Gemmataceae bacterium]|nr:hypothetical protein [Gemmataceae bacterium]
MRRDSLHMRGDKPFLMVSLRRGDGVESLVSWVRDLLAATDNCARN